MKISFFAKLGAAIIGGMMLLAPDVALAAKGKVDTPTIAGGDVTPGSIDIIVTAGATGAPAGFSLQWMTKEEYEANGNMWYVSEVVCKASFSGNANGSTFNLAPNMSVTVNIGDSLFDQAGASSTCMQPLDPCTTYVFHAFAHATSKLARSDFSSPNLEVSTGGCNTTVCRTYPNGYGSASYGNCTLTQGYWKTHGFLPTGNNWNEWAFTEMTLGTIPYSQGQVQSIFDKAAAGNKLISLAHQLIAATINIGQGATPSQEVIDGVAAAHALIGGLVIPPVGTGSFTTTSQGTAAASLIQLLTDFNEGAMGTPHCGGSDDGCTRPSAPIL